MKQFLWEKGKAVYEEKDLLRYHCLIVGGSLEEDRVIMSVGDLLSASDAVDYSKITEIVYVPLEDYNRLTWKRRR